MSEDEFYQRAEAVKLDTLSDVNDIGKPWRYEEDGLTVTRTSPWSPPGCHPVGCGLKLYVDDGGRLVRVEGDENNPVTQGRLCPRCLALKDYIYNPARLLHPMKRDPKERGNADAWERITWDEAFDIIKDEYDRITAAYGRESIVVFAGTGREGGTFAPYGTMCFGTPNFCYTQSGYACYTPRLAAIAYIAGTTYPEWDYAGALPGRWEDERYELTECLVVWGKAPLESNPDGFFGHAVIDAMRRGTRLIVIDPRVNWLATRADIHLQLRAGTDTALGMAWLNVIINEDLYDHDFVDRWCYGFEELSEHVQPFTPEYAETTTWVPAERIRKAARILAASRPATLQWGVAVDMTREAMPAGQAILALWEITGNMERPGGMIVAPEILSVAGGWGREILGPEQEAKRIGIKDYPLYNFGFAVSQPDETVKTIETGVPYEIHGAWLQTTNPIACMGADPQRLYKALNKLDFIVVVDLFKTPTIAALADVVLPACTFPERNGIAFVSGAQRGSTINKVTDVGECRSDMQINLELGKRWNPEAWPWDNVDEMFTDMLKPTDMSFEELQEVAPAYQPIEYYRYKTGKLRKDGQPGFNTPTGRIELWSNFYNQAGLDPLPYFEEPEPGPGSTPDLMGEYPLVMTSGARTWGMFHSEHRQIERMRHYRPWPLMEIHPETAAKYGIKDGDWVWMEGPMGRAKRKAKLTPVMDRRIVSCDHGWWFPEGDPEKFYDVFDLNINNTLPWIPGKSGFGSNYKSSICKIYKVEEGE